MAAPNIVNVSTITAKTTALTPTVTTSVVLLRNPASSNMVLKVNLLLASNITASNVTCTLNYYTNGGVAQGSAPSGGTAFPIISNVVVPTTASLIAIDKPTTIYLEENNSITVTSSVGSSITYLVSYEELS
jgi:hypothetical protein